MDFKRTYAVQWMGRAVAEAHFGTAFRRRIEDRCCHDRTWFVVRCPRATVGINIILLVGAKQI